MHSFVGGLKSHMQNITVYYINKLNNNVCLVYCDFLIFLFKGFMAQQREQQYVQVQYEQYTRLHQR